MKVALHFASLFALSVMVTGSASMPLQAQIVVTNEDGNTITLIDPSSNQILGSITVGSGPSAVVFLPDGSRAYTTNTNDGTVSVVNMLTRTLITNITVGNDPNSVAITPNGLKLYVTNSDDGTVSVISTATNTVLTTILLPLTAPDAFIPTPQTIAITPDGTKAFVANEDGVNSYIINTATDVAAPINIGIQAESVGITPDGTKAYFGGQLPTATNVGKVQVFNIGGNTLGALLTLPASPHAVAIAPNGLKAYTTNEDDGSISVIDTVADTIVGTIQGLSEPARIAFSPDGSIMYVTDTGDAANDGDPRSTHNNAVVMFETVTNAIAGPNIQMGDDPEGIAFSPLSKFFANPNVFLSFFFN